MDKGHRFLLCVTGGIAAYKAIDLASRLVKSGFEVKSILTANAERFVSGMNFAAITHNDAHTDMWTDTDPIPHITLADWADLIVVAPATANIMAKAVTGIADDLLSSVLLAHTKPVLFVPAMNVHMYSHPATQANIISLKRLGHNILEPVTGMLACGYEGKGKYPPNAEVLYAIRTYLNYSQDIKGIKVLVSAGATMEMIDPMRMISNRSSGKMGLAIARALALRGAQVTLVHADIRCTIPYYLDKVIYAPSVQDMRTAVIMEGAAADWIVKCAAVSDFKPETSSPRKIKKGGDLNLKLVSTTDILLELSTHKNIGQKLIGFAAETEDLIKNARLKLEKKKLDLICVNHLDTVGKDETKLSLISAGANNEDVIELSGDKFHVAHLLIDAIKAL
ncbi:MAG: bifunctional phosphopantothenoylcysteine decarboxylase/phosphopantothenate--cysteine ligase CoaBC [Candidatus Cloacimonadaceae bacterium]|nr:bifunctional phosphopantothenoylcysteine decarboxylase/phosphopantothenate--cysteine ligase CoaBC [Candidatus Cloacimonadaceae bacterium]